ncbi:hypothetical protein [Priestia endophytica]|jgi:hypothetical protein|uniref:hypothetical protein n=1 Tax=Priestia endophytica TaxID=135735 RepID=UPI002E205F71|nr:hypothetical protein [Priestia endophytica]
MNNREWMKEMSDMLLIFLKGNRFSLSSFFEKASFHIDSIEELAMIHFLLQDETAVFLEELTKTRELFPSSTNVHKKHSGKMAGHIQWKKTIEARSREGFTNRATYVSGSKNRTFGTKENKVLKACLNMLRSLVQKHGEKTELLSSVRDYEQKINNYLAFSPLTSISCEEITNEEIKDVTTSKVSLYRQAALLLLQYHRLNAKKVSEEDLLHLFQRTFWQPEQMDVLFELYWALKLVKENTKEATLHLLYEGENLVASWEDMSYTYKLYHNSKGSALSFSVKMGEVDESDHPYLARKVLSQKEANRLGNQFFATKAREHIFWQGRPDLVVEMREKGRSELYKAVVGEVKFTDSETYAKEGLRELCDYLYFAKVNNSYAKEGMIEGRLFLRDAPFSNIEEGKISAYSLSSSTNLAITP